MAKGGKRPGAGRPKGKENKATQKRRDIAEQALTAGVTPLEVMLATMRAIWLQAQSADGIDVTMAKEAHKVAKDAAPYVHPHLAAVEHSGTLEHLLKQLEEAPDADLEAKARLLAPEAGTGPTSAGAGKTQGARPGAKKPH